MQYDIWSKLNISISVEKSAETFPKLESSIYVLLSYTEKRNLGRDIENAGQKDKKSK